MKNKIKYILAAIVSIVGIGLLIFALYLQIQKTWLLKYPNVLI